MKQAKNNKINRYSTDHGKVNSPVQTVHGAVPCSSRLAGRKIPREGKSIPRDGNFARRESRSVGRETRRLGDNNIYVEICLYLS